MVYLPFRCGDLVHADNAGNIPAGITYSFSSHGIEEIDNSTGSYGAGTENHRKTDISAGIAWVGMGNLNFHGNVGMGMGNSKFVSWLGETTGTIFTRKREIIPIPVKTCGDVPREFSRGLPCNI